MRPLYKMPIDRRLLRRRECEFSIFQSIEHEVVFPRIQQGFSTVDEFTTFANSVMNRRKSRSGTSLELHLKKILNEEGLQEDKDYSHNKPSEPGKKPDFLFPSASSYNSPSFPKDKLRMLGVKTTCKDRWRQILNEADRIPSKHLFTLQQGVSERQFQEMEDAKVKLVVPAPLHTAYPKVIRPKLVSLQSFIEEIRKINS